MRTDRRSTTVAYQLPSLSFVRCGRWWCHFWDSLPWLHADYLKVPVTGRWSSSCMLPIFTRWQAVTTSGYIVLPTTRSCTNTPALEITAGQARRHCNHCRDQQLESVTRHETQRAEVWSYLARDQTTSLVKPTRRCIYLTARYLHSPLSVTQAFLPFST